MAYLYGLVLAAAFFLFSPFANAQSIPATATPAPTVGKWTAGSGPTTKVFTNAVLACQDNGIRGYGWTYGLINTVARSGVTPAVHDCNWTAPPAPYQGYWGSTSVVQTCVPSGGFLSDPCPVTYTCPANYTLNGSMCDPVAPNQCQELTGSSAGEYSGLGSVGLKTVCVQDSATTNSGDPALPGCVLTGTADFAAGTPYRWVARLSFSGAKCVPGAHTPGSTDPNVPNTPDEPDATPCAPPKLPGTVNGQTVCVDAGPTDPSQQTNTNSTTQTNPDGTTVGTGTTSTTECTATTCTTTTTTTTTTTPPGGSPTTGMTTTTGTCSRSAPGCGQEDGEDEPSSFGGTCGAAFACDGDAIMCAVALEQHKRNCALFVDSSPESDLYNSEKGKTGTQYQNENVALSTGSFNQSNALGAAAQCIQDRTVTVMGNVIVLPFSIICNTLQHFGSILIFVSFLLAYRIVSRG